MANRASNIVNIDTVEEISFKQGDYWCSADRPLTPAMQPRMGRLGVNLTRIPPEKSGCPFHAHQIEDEVFYILAGRGVLRYGKTLQAIGPGDCISCPAGTGTAHQIANPFTEDLIYLAIGINDPNEVCIYPDSGKIMVRSLSLTGHLAAAEYFDGEPEVPKIFDLAKTVIRRDESTEDDWTRPPLRA